MAVPSPRSHLAGTLELLGRFERIAAGAGGRANAYAAAARALLDRPGDLPASVASERNGLKYDAYLSRGPDRIAWGFTVNDRWEEGGFLPHVSRFVEAVPGPYAWRRALDAAERLGGMPTLSVGFDRPDAPPRIKLYFQEDAWGAGVAEPSEIAELASALAPGCALPGWIERRIGVVTLELWPGERVSLKVYLGGQTAPEAAAGAPREIRDLARVMAEVCPLTPSWHYLTVRCRPGEHRYAINKIYDHNSLGFGERARPAESWREVYALFRAAGRGGAMVELLEALRGLKALPTATAFEDRGRSADVYCAAWAPPYDGA